MRRSPAWLPICPSRPPSIDPPPENRLLAPPSLRRPCPSVSAIVSPGLVPGTPYLTAWANSGKSGRATREQALRLRAIRQARLEQPELSGSSQERMVYGPTATSGGKRIDFSTGIAWFGDIIKSTALNTARTGSISAFQLSQQFGSFGLGSGFSHDFAPLHRLTLAFGHACRTIR